MSLAKIILRWNLDDVICREMVGATLRVHRRVLAVAILEYSCNGGLK
jgi:hypothetical protein